MRAGVFPAPAALTRPIQGDCRPQTPATAPNGPCPHTPDGLKGPSSNTATISACPLP